MEMTRCMLSQAAVAMLHTHHVCVRVCMCVCVCTAVHTQALINMAPFGAIYVTLCE